MRRGVEVCFAGVVDRQLVILAFFPVEYCPAGFLNESQTCDTVHGGRKGSLEPGGCLESGDWYLEGWAFGTCIPHQEEIDIPDE